MGCIGGYLLPYYTKENVLTKKIIFKYFTEDAELLRYLPNNPKIETISREFLLSVLANVKREKYAQMYVKYKEIKIQRSTGGNKVYHAEITNEFKSNKFVSWYIIVKIILFIINYRNAKKPHIKLHENNNMIPQIKEFQENQNNPPQIRENELFHGIQEQNNNEIIDREDNDLNIE